jgi:acetyl esterase
MRDQRPLDAQSAALLERLGSGADKPFPPDLAALREPWPEDDPALLPPRPLRDVADLLVPARPPVYVRLYVPDSDAPRPALVWLHPGGFVAGAVDDIDGVCRELSAEARCAVISVDYRLAPEHPFPAAVDDTVAVLAWLDEHAAALGIDPSRIAAGGQSAGATIVASTIVRLRDEGSALPRLQILAYPVLDPALDAPSYTENDGVLFTVRDLAWYWRCYLGGGPPDPLAAPLLVRNLHGLPPALLLAAGHDPARDDTRRYAQRLSDADVATDLVEYDATMHAFLSFANLLDVARDALALIAHRLRADLAAGHPRLQHVGLPYPPGRERDVRAFYGDALGLPEKPVPRAFADQGFVWFAAGPGEAELHLIPRATPAGSDQGPSHACLATERLDGLVERLEQRGYELETHEVIVNRPQAFFRDPFGNLLELTHLRGAYS